MHQEFQYLNLVRRILTKGELVQGRNGYVKEVFGESMRFSLDDSIPILTTKRVAWKTCLRELLWFIRGSTDNSELKNEKVNIWNENASREFLDSRGLFEREVDDLGPIYGYQWRNFNHPYKNCKTEYPKDKESDQLAGIIQSLKHPETRKSRRHIMTAWNPLQLDEMALPPCHIMAQFHTSNENRLSCSLYQRSADVALGMPFNIASYSFLTYLIANECGMIPHEFVYFVGNAHIYEPHIRAMEQQLLREPYPFPKCIIHPREGRTFETYRDSDFELVEYKHHPKIQMNMVA